MLKNRTFCRNQENADGRRIFLFIIQTIANRVPPRNKKVHFICHLITVIAFQVVSESETRDMGYVANHIYITIHNIEIEKMYFARLRFHIRKRCAFAFLILATCFLNCLDIAV